MTRDFDKGLKERYNPDIDPFHDIDEEEAKPIIDCAELQRMFIGMIGDLVLLSHEEFVCVSTAYRILRQWDDTPAVADNERPRNASNLAHSRPAEELPINAAYLAAKDELKAKGVNSQDSFRKHIRSAIEKAGWIKALVPD